MSDPYQDHPNVSPGIDSVWGSAGGQTLWIPQTALNGGIAGRDGNRYAFVAGVIRNSGPATYWATLNDDTNHHHVNVDSVTTDTNSITINYPNLNASRVVSFIASVDDTLVQYGFSVAGPSVTPTAATLKLSQQRTLNADIGWNGSAFVVNNQNTDPSGNFTVGTYSGGDLHITHDDMGANNQSAISITPRGDTYLAMIPNDNGVQQAGFFVSFYTFAGVKQTTAATGMRFYVQRSISAHVNPQTVDTTKYPNSNIWFFGVFEL